MRSKGLNDGGKWTVVVEEVRICRGPWGTKWDR